MDDLTTEIDDLTEPRALAVLSAVLEQQGIEVNAEVAQVAHARVQEALRQPEIVDLAPPPDGESTPGAIARLVLTELARRDPARSETIRRAIETTASQDRLDPATLAIGALVLFAFHSDIELRKDPAKGWSFHFRTTPLKDSAIGRILGKLLILG